MSSHTHSAFEEGAARDFTFLQDEAGCCLAAVICGLTVSQATQQHLLRGLAAELSSPTQSKADALAAALAELRAAARGSHAPGPPVLHAAVAHLHRASRTLLLASCGEARAALGLPSAGQVRVVAAEGPAQPAESQREDSPSFALRVLQLPEGAAADVVLGSPGFWHEVTPARAALRAACHAALTPRAHGGSAAAALVEAALGAVCRRLRGHPDPRLACLRHPGHLRSLARGDRASRLARGGVSQRQLVQRRRGDVHGDLTTLVARLQHPPAGQPPPCPLPSEGVAGSAPGEPPQRSPAQQRWALLRAHFLLLPLAERAQAQSVWREVTTQALAQHRAGQPMAAAQLRADSGAGPAGSEHSGGATAEAETPSPASCAQQEQQQQQQQQQQPRSFTPTASFRVRHGVSRPTSEVRYGGSARALPTGGLGDWLRPASSLRRLVRAT